MEFGPLALCSLLVIITKNILWPKLCWMAQILTIIFDFCNEPLKKGKSAVLRAWAWVFSPVDMFWWALQQLCYRLKWSYCNFSYSLWVYLIILLQAYFKTLAVIKASVHTKKPIMRDWEQDLSIIDLTHLNAFTVIFGKYDSNKYIWAESHCQVRVIDSQKNTLRRQPPRPLICRTALSGSVCMAASAPHYSFSCHPLSVCWWRTLPRKDLEDVLLLLLKLFYGLTEISYLGSKAT